MYDLASVAYLLALSRWGGGRSCCCTEAPSTIRETIHPDLDSATKRALRREADTRTEADEA